MLNPMPTAAQVTALAAQNAGFPFFIRASLSYVVPYGLLLSGRSEGKRRIRPRWDKQVHDSATSNPRYHPRGFKLRPPRASQLPTRGSPSQTGGRAVVSSPDASSSMTLLARAQAGDREALDLLIARFLPRMRRWAHG